MRVVINQLDTGWFLYFPVEDNTNCTQEDVTLTSCDAKNGELSKVARTAFNLLMYLPWKQEKNSIA